MCKTLLICDKYAGLRNKYNNETNNDDIERHRLRRLYIHHPQISYNRKSLKRVGGCVMRLGRGGTEGRRKVTLFGEEEGEEEEFLIREEGIGECKEGRSRADGRAGIVSVGTWADLR